MTLTWHLQWSTMYWGLQKSMVLDWKWSPRLWWQREARNFLHVTWSVQRPAVCERGCPFGHVPSAALETGSGSGLPEAGEEGETIQKINILYKWLVGFGTSEVSRCPGLGAKVLTLCNDCATLLHTQIHTHRVTHTLTHRHGHTHFLLIYLKKQY